MKSAFDDRIDDLSAHASQDPYLQQQRHMIPREKYGDTERQGYMKPVSSSLQDFCSAMPEEVRKRVLTERYIKKIYDQFAQVVDEFILEHVNSLYLFKSTESESARDLVVYLDNSMCAAELNARRELIRLKYREQFGVVIDVFEIRISRGSYRDTYPFRERDKQKRGTQERELTSEDKRRIDEIIAPLPEGKLKESFQRALSSQKRHTPQK